MTQPIQFSHKAHVEKGLPCDGCHQSVARAASAGIPTTETCMMCHQGAITDSPEEEKVRQYAEKGLQVPWQRVYEVPAHVYFSHRRHVSLGRHRVRAVSRSGSRQRGAGDGSRGAGADGSVRRLPHPEGRHHRLRRMSQMKREPMNRNEKNGFKVSRRGFLALSGAGAAGVAVSGCGPHKLADFLEFTDRTQSPRWRRKMGDVALRPVRWRMLASCPHGRRARGQHHRQSVLPPESQRQSAQRDWPALQDAL